MTMLKQTSSHDVGRTREASTLITDERRIKHAGAIVDYVRRQQLNKAEAYTIIANGFCGIHRSYIPLGEAIARLDPGMGVVTFSPPRRLDLRHSVALRNSLHPSLMLPKAIWGIMKDVMAETGVEKFHIVGNSMGGPAALAVAENALRHGNGGLIKSVELVSSAGATKQHPARLVAGMTAMAKNEIMPNRARLADNLGLDNPLRAGIEMANYVLHTQTAREAIAVSRVNILDRAAAVAESGITVNALWSPADPLFSAPAAEQNLSGRVHAYRELEYPEGAGHAAAILFGREVALALHDQRIQQTSFAAGA